MSRHQQGDSTASPVPPPPPPQPAATTVSAPWIIFRKFIGGTIGGFMQAVCAHPFDTIKSRVQMGGKSISGCIRDTLAKEGVTGFYKGVTPPIMIGGFYNAVLFSTNQFMQGLVRPAYLKPGEKLPIPYIMLAAELTAPISIFVLTPFEVAKVRLQLQRDKAVYTGVFDCWRKVFAEEGMKGVFRGYFPTWGSRIIGLPLYFATQDVSRDWIISQLPSEKQTPGNVPGWVPAVSGAMCGIVFWCACYPMDFIKTRRQSALNQSAFEIASSTFRTEGIRGFYRGFAPCLVRAVLANGPVWYGIEKSVAWMERNGL